MIGSAYRKPDITAPSLKFYVINNQTNDPNENAFLWAVIKAIRNSITQQNRVLSEKPTCN